MYPEQLCKPMREDLTSRKGDGKPYQLRIKSNREDYFSYVFSFETSRCKCTSTTSTI